MSEPEPYVIPEPRGIVEVPLGDGASIVVRRHGNLGGKRIVLSHGNGLAADLYYPFWSRFLPDFEVVVFDLRNHGWNRSDEAAEHNPHVFSRDIDEAVLPAIDRAFGKKPSIGMFHSLSALLSLLLPSRGAWFAGLVLFDPPLCRPGMSQIQFDAHVETICDLLRRRSKRFRSENDLVRLLLLSPDLRGADRGLRVLYARTTLRPHRDGNGYEPRCPPEYEAQGMEFINAYAVLADLDQMVPPVKVIGADPTLPYTYLPSFDVNLVTHVDYDFVPEVGHLLQIVAPERCYELAMGFLKQRGLDP